jgi:hypothetical protein
MHNIPFDTVDLDAGEVQALEDTYKALKAKFNISLPDDSNQHINKFELFNNTGSRLGGTLFINQPAISCYLNFVKNKFSYSVGGRGGQGGQIFSYDKYQAWAFVTLDRDFGRIVIRRETFTDKILEIVHPIELKFKDDRLFNEYFYVVTNDKEKAAAAMTPAFRKIIVEMMYKDFVIETIGSTLVIRGNQPIDPEKVINMTEFASKIAELK